jgi:hypothetical protein
MQTPRDISCKDRLYSLSSNSYIHGDAYELKTRINKYIKCNYYNLNQEMYTNVLDLQ